MSLMLVSMRQRVGWDGRRLNVLELREVRPSGGKESAQRVDGLVLMASSKQLSFCVTAFQSAAARRMHATPIW